MSSKILVVSMIFWRSWTRTGRTLWNDRRNTAKVYLKKKEELKECDQNLFLLEMERMDTELEGLEEKCGITEHQQAEIRQKFEGIKSRYEELEKQVAQADEQIGELQQGLNDTGVSKEKLEGQINVLREQIHTARRDEEHVRSRVEALQADVDRQQEGRRGLRQPADGTGSRHS